MGRFQQSYITGRYKPKKGEIVSKGMLPPGAGIQTEYVGWFEQPGRAATLKASKATKEGVVKTQKRDLSGAREVVTTDLKKEKMDIRLGSMQGNFDQLTIGPWGSEVSAFGPDPFDTTTKVAQTIPLRGSIIQKLPYKGKPRGVSKAVTSTGKFTKKQTKTGRHSLSTKWKTNPQTKKKYQFKREARKGWVEGKKYTGNKLTGDFRNEVELDKVFAKSVRDKQAFTKTLNLGVWRKLNIKQKSEVLKAAGVV